MRMPLCRKSRSWKLAGQRKALAGPLLVALVEQWQIKQPFAGIVDDIERQCPVGAILALVVDNETQLADIGRRVRPAALFDERANVVLIVEPRHGVIGLRLKPCSRDPPARQGLENRKTAAANEAVNQGGNKDVFPRPRQSGDAKPDRRVEKMVAVIEKCSCRQAGFFDDIGKLEGHAGAMNSM